jgi:hypothetical protein
LECIGVGMIFGLLKMIERNTFVVIVKVAYLAYVETNTPKYTVTTLATHSQLLWILLNYFRS